ncbi:MAG: DUF4079 domain-containing protein, partial [Cyanobacteria bacterium P01_H01_bin.121]
LEPIAAWFRSFNIPEPVTHWGHPVMMGIVVLVLGGYVAYAGWQSRLSQDKETANQKREDHRKLAPLMSLFIFLGYTGGVLSLVMQQQPIFQSAHFWTGSAALILLGLNGSISLFGFKGASTGLRAVHAYIGTVVMALLIIHGVFGLQLGLSI